MLLSFAVDWLLLMGTNKLCNYPPDWKNTLPAAAFGGVYAGAVRGQVAQNISGDVYDENGVTNGIYSPEGIEALERAVKIFKETCSDCFHPEDAHGGPGVDWFVNGDIFMLTLPGTEMMIDESSVMYRANNVNVNAISLFPTFL